MCHPPQLLALSSPLSRITKNTQHRNSELAKTLWATLSQTGHLSNALDKCTSVLQIWLDLVVVIASTSNICVFYTKAETIIRINRDGSIIEIIVH